MIKGDPLAPFEIEAKLRARLTLLDTPGLVGLALAGIDMAAWDALAQAHGLPLVTLLGGSIKAIPAYNSTGLWIQPVETLADEAEALLAEGFTAVKLRVGRDDAAEDLAAVRAVKQRIGDRAILMCDFNQRLTVNEAIRRGRVLDGEGLHWIEEPVRHDDYEGYARIAAEIQTPDPDRREPGGHLRDGAGHRRPVARLRHARRAAHRRGHRLAARGRAGARPRHRDVQPPLPRVQRPSARGHADVSLAGVHGLGRARAPGAAQGHGRASP